MMRFALALSQRGLRMIALLVMVTMILTPSVSAQGFEIQWIPVDPSVPSSRYGFPHDFREGVAMGAKYVNLWCFYGADGKRILCEDPNLEIAGDIMNGRFRVQHTFTGKYGFCDAKGTLIIPAVYDEIEIHYFDDGYCVVKRDGWTNVIDLGGNELLPAKTYGVDDYSIQVHKGGYISVSGAVYDPDRLLQVFAIEGMATKFVGEYRRVEPAGEGLLSVTQDGDAYGAINKSGHVVVPYRYYNGIKFSDGLAAAWDRQTDCVTYIDSNGKQAFAGSWPSGLNFVDGYAIIFNEEDHPGIIDKTGKQVAPYLDQSYFIEHFNEGMLVFCDGPKRGVLSAVTGKLVVNPDDGLYDLIGSFSEGVATVQVETGDYINNVRGSFAKVGYTCGLIDTNGQVVVPADGTYHELEACREGMIPAVRYQFTELHVGSDGTPAYDYNSSYGYIDRNGDVVHDLTLQWAGAFENGVSMVVKDGLWALMKNPLPESLRRYQPTTEASAVSTIPVPTRVAAEPIRSHVMIDGQKVAFDAYSVANSSYFRLRDLAMALRGSGSQFAVSWDGSRDAVCLLTSQLYSPVSGELTVTGDPTVKDAFLTTSRIFIDQTELPLTAYTINGSTYFRLRDLGQAVGFGVSWDEAANTIRIDTRAD